MKVSWSVITSYSLERTTGSFYTNYLLEGHTKSSSEGTLKDNDASAKSCNTQEGHGGNIQNLLRMYRNRFLIIKIV